MNHLEAVKRQAADRYLLGELSGSETSEFEEHYFGCADCAAELESAAILVENARAVLPEFGIAAERPATGWRLWLESLRRPWFAIPTFATCVLACVCTYQAFLLRPDLQQLPSFALAGRSRGAEAAIMAPRGARYVAVSFDLDPQAAYPQYRCELQDAGGATRYAASAAPPSLGEPVTLLLPAKKLGAGRYTLTVSGVPQSGGAPVKISDYSFDLAFK
jgi:anti-sigma factor RsiW